MWSAWCPYIYYVYKEICDLAYEGSNLPQVVATEFIASVQAETPVTQRSPCYSAVSASLTNPLPDCSNYSQFCHTHYLILHRHFIKPFCWRLILHCLQHFTAESSWELMSLEEYRRWGSWTTSRGKWWYSSSSSSNCHLNSLLFLSLFFLSLLPFLILSLLPFLTIPFSSDQLSVLLR